MSFNPDSWFEVLGALKPERPGYWSFRSIEGPRDACTALKIRELIRDLVHFGTGAATDVFLLSVGESPTRDCTKIGGLPFWPRCRKWPTAATGEPLPFLGQFDFRDSTDIVGNLPGDLLLVFASPDFRNGLVIEWETVAGHAELVHGSDVPVAPIVPAYYGTRWRTLNYPNWQPFNDQWSEVLLPDGTVVLDVYLVLGLLGVQIGPSPFLPAWGGVVGENEQVLCSLCSVSPLPGRSFPFLNQREPLTEDEAKQLAAIVSTWGDDYSFGVLYVIATKDGGFRWHVEIL